MKYKECTIHGYEGLYYIYENGDIYSVRKKRMLKPYPNGFYGYLYVCLTGVKGNTLRTGAHRIVAHHWICKQPDNHIIKGRYEVNHIDNNPKNNHYTNLEWTTHSDNILKAVINSDKWGGNKPGYKHTDYSRELMRQKKMKKVALISDTQHVICNSIESAAEYLNTYRDKVSRYLNSHKTLNGFILRHIE